MGSEAKILSVANTTLVRFAILLSSVSVVLSGCTPGDGGPGSEYNCSWQEPEGWTLMPNEQVREISESGAEEFGSSATMACVYRGPEANEWFDYPYMIVGLQQHDGMDLAAMKEMMAQIPDLEIKEAGADPKSWFAFREKTETVTVEPLNALLHYSETVDGDGRISVTFAASIPGRNHLWQASVFGRAENLDELFSRFSDVVLSFSFDEGYRAPN